MKWKPRNAAKNKDRKQFVITLTDKKGRQRTQPVWHYTCAICGPETWHREKQVQMDHINPVVDQVAGWQGFDIFIDRLLVEEPGWQRICKPHHEEKSGKENTTRTVTKRSRKKKISS